MNQWVRAAFEKLRAIFGGEELDRDFDAELTGHLELLIQEHRARGLDPTEARRQALIRLGGLQPTRELHRDARGLPAWESFAQDLRYAVRALRRDAGFSTVAILVLALGIGANTAIFSVANALLFRPLPFRDPQRLVWIANTEPEGGLSGVTTRVQNFQDWQRMSRSFESLTGFMAFSDYSSYTLVENGEPESLIGFMVAQNFFSVLGVQPEIGRGFTDEECKWNGRPAVILSHGLWERRFAADPRILGRAIRLNDRDAIVAGVMPRSFDFASVFAPGSRVDLLVPFPLATETDRWGNTMAVIGRLKPGAGVARTQAEMDLLNRQIMRADPGRWMFGARLTPLQEQISGRFRRALLVLLGAVGLVLLIACANVANLLLARASVRRREIAVRTALGAGRARLIRQMLTESLALSGCGALLGLALAFAITRTLSGTHAIQMPLLDTVGVDGTALAFTVGVALVAGVLFGMAPAFASAGPHMHDALKDSARGSSEGQRGTWVRGALVSAEIALACVLLVGAGLLLRSFLRVLDVDLGFQPARTAAWRIRPGSKYATRVQRVALYRELIRAVRSLPGVDSAGISDTLPLGRNRSWGAWLRNKTYGKGEVPIVFPRVVDAGYIPTMRIALRAGRNLSEQDTADSPRVVVINEKMAREFWPGQNPINRMVVVNGRDLRVVGVVANVRHSALEQEGGLEIYLPFAQEEFAVDEDLVIRTKLEPEALAPSIRAALRSIDPLLPTAQFQTLDQIVDRAVSPRRFVVLLLGAFALLALALASLGIYGVVSYAVSQRTLEIGIRMALGASAGHVQLRVLRQTVVLTLAGAAVGLLASFGMARWMRSLLFGVTPADPATFAAMIMLLTAIAVLAGYLPARRASHIDPMSALRCE